jgi:hypothetical protein
MRFNPTQDLLLEIYSINFEALRELGKMVLGLDPASTHRDK